MKFALQPSSLLMRAPALSLAGKCRLLFGVGVAAITILALVLPWVRLGSVVRAGQLDHCRRVAELGEALLSRWPTAEVSRFTARDSGVGAGAGELCFVPFSSFDSLVAGGGFPAAAARRFTANRPRASHGSSSSLQGGGRVYRYARAVRDGADGPLQGMLLVQASSDGAGVRLFRGRLSMLVAGFIAATTAVLLFHFIATKIILRPVGRLRDTARRIGQGDRGVRAEIKTGDEYEQLAEAFNAMVESLEENERRLRGVNESLDLKVAELSESNRALHESAEMKNDFLAGVSHELRTPLNSIIGFAELLLGIAQSEMPSPRDDSAVQHEKRRRYLENILTAGRTQLELINDLLDMARLEAGKVRLHVEVMSVSAVCEGLVALVRPQADRKEVGVRVELFERAACAEYPAPVAPGVGVMVRTDPRKFQQIVFNFLSNAVKFTPRGGAVTLRAERLLGGDGEARVRVSVLDTGPGIAAEDQDRIFDKFTRVERGHVRHHPGAGLGLAICKELAGMIRGEIQLVSEPGRGSMFSVLIPPEIPVQAPDAAPEPAHGAAGPGVSVPGAAAGARDASAGGAQGAS